MNDEWDQSALRVAFHVRERACRCVESSHDGEAVSSGADFSPCRRYRYRLWRTWDADLPAVAFCMLNPSTADETTNDPTIERCERRARMWGYGSLIVVNLFAWRATNPRDMKAAVDPVGPSNFDAIVAALRESDMFICAWGVHGAHLDMGRMILTRMREFHPGRAHALKVNKDGMPAHPLYLPYSLTPTPMDAAMVNP